MSKGLKMLCEEALESTVRSYDERVVIYAVLFGLVVVGTLGLFVVFAGYGYKYDAF